MRESTKDSEAHRKGKFLETLVAFLHEIVGADVERNALLPTSDGSGREREVDVSVKVASEEMAGCPIHIPIECKNYGASVGIEQIDAFVGKLQDIGIDTNLGIYVAASGYTSGAARRAHAVGIKTLLAEGLTRDRVALEVQEILPSLVFWVAEWRSTSHFHFVPTRDGPAESLVVDLPSGASWEVGSLDVIWRLWLRGTIPRIIGPQMYWPPTVHTASTVQRTRSGGGGHHCSWPVLPDGEHSCGEILSRITSAGQRDEDTGSGARDAQCFRAH